MATSFQLKKIYNFNIISDAASVLGEKYKLMKVKAIFTSAEAVKYSDIATTHETVKGLISNLPESLTDLTYILFESQAGDNFVTALEYIDTNTILEVNAINIRVNIPKVNTEDMVIVKQALAELGYTKFEVTTYE